MKNIKKITVAVCVIVGAVIALTVKFAADQQWMTIDRPSFMRETPDGKLAILIGQRLLVVDRAGNTAGQIDFTAKGLKVHGDFDFFSNGDVLLYSQHSEPAWWEAPVRYMRMTELRKSPPQQGEGLLRCDADIGQCRRFSAKLPAFHSSFRLHIRRSDDTVFIADTPRHVLYKVNDAGEIVAISAPEFKFPNQLFLLGDKLLVADTNHHRVAEVESDDDGFGRVKSAHVAIIDANHAWPAQIATADSMMWVLIADEEMRYGQLQIYDSAWSAISRASLDVRADPLGLTFYNGVIWVSDYSNYRIYRYESGGARLADFHNSELDAVFLDLQRQAERYRAVARYALIAFGLIVAAGFVAAFFLEKDELARKWRESVAPPVAQLQPLESPPGDGIHWISHRFHRYTRAIAMGAGGWLLLFLTIYFRLLSDVEKPLGWKFHLSMLSLLPVFIFTAWSFVRVAGYRIGISGPCLLADDGAGRVGAGKGEAIRYTSRVLIVENVAVPLGNGRVMFFPRQEFDRWVRPRMLGGQSIGPLEALKAQWKIKDPLLIVQALFLIYVLAVLAAVKLLPV